MINRYQLPNIFQGYGFGPITSHKGHGCPQLSAFTFDNIWMETGGANWKMFRVEEKDLRTGKANANRLYSHTHLADDPYTEANTYRLREKLNPGDYEDAKRVDMTVTYSLQYTQNVDFELWSVDPDVWDNENGVPLSLETNLDTWRGATYKLQSDSAAANGFEDPRLTKIGYIKSSNRGKLQNIHAIGYDGDLPTVSPTSMMTLFSGGNEDAIPVVSNSFQWRGAVVDASGATIAVPDGNYVMVLQPKGVNSTTWTEDYPSYALLTIDSAKTAVQPADTHTDGAQGGETGEANFDPVNMANGNFYWEHTALSIAGREAFDFGLFHSVQAGTNGVMGQGWKHSHLYAITDELLNTTVHLPLAGDVIFRKNLDDSLEAPSGSKYRLEKNEYRLDADPRGGQPLLRLRCGR
jgi:hypothetical protein